MSTIAEHLAALEMYRANGENDLFCSEAYLFTQVHWKEMISAINQEEMERARTEIENRLREQHGEKAEPFIEKWHGILADSADSAKNVTTNLN